MRKIFTLIVMLFCVIGYSNAETYEWYVSKSGKNYVQTLAPSENNIFNVPSNMNLNTKFAGKYKADDGTEYDFTAGGKMEGSTSITFTTTKKATLTLVECNTFKSAADLTNRGFKLDGNVIKVETAPELTNGYDNNIIVHKVEIDPGEHTLVRNNKEAGLFYMKAEYAEGETIPMLDAPVITADENGLVTIAAPENASVKEVRYSIDGTSPTAESNVYNEPFTVADNTTVKAIAITNDETVALNSPIASLLVSTSAGTIETPVISQFNGTFAITCSTANVTLEYSLDGGETYVKYNKPVTLFADATVTAHATREGWTEATTTADIEALPAVESNKTILMGWGSFTADGQVLTGVEGDPAEGFTLTIIHDDAKKTWASVKDVKIAMGDGVSRTNMYGSNGAPIKMTVPSNYVVKRITFYSYLSAVTDRNSGWKEVNGEANNSCNLVPMMSTSADDPDVRVFNIGEYADNEFTFVNGGERPFFVMAVDVLDLTPAAPEAPVMKDEDGNELSEINLDDTEGVTVKFEATEGHNVYYLFIANAPIVTPEAAPAKEAAATLEHEGETYILAPAEGVKITEAGTLKYFAHNPVTGARSEVKSATATGTTTGIADINADVNAPVEYFNLQGIRVANPENGMFIRRQGTQVTKVIK